MAVDWSREDYDQSHREGWGLHWENGGIWARYYNKRDPAPLNKFQSDGDALAFVTRRAEEGSEPHQRALMLAMRGTPLKPDEFARVKMLQDYNS